MLRQHKKSRAIVLKKLICQALTQHGSILFYTPPSILCPPPPPPRRPHSLPCTQKNEIFSRPTGSKNTRSISET